MKNSSRQYPSQLGKYAVKVKNGRGWDAFSTARFQISVGQEYHEGEKFKATIEWAKHRFDKVIICVNDTLQRHNHIYKDNLDTLSAFRRSENAGREWIERNISTIRSLPNYELHRWEDWKSHPDFVAEYNYILNLYEKDSYVRDYILHEVLIFWKRRMVKENGALDYSFVSFKEASVNYLLEETAAFFLMFRRNHAVDIYPGSVLLPCVLAKKYCKGLENASLGDRCFTRIDFQRNDADQKQTA